MLSSTGVRLQCLFGLIRNKINNEMMESLCALASCEPRRLRLHPAERSLVFRRATLVGTPSTTPGPWLGAPRVPAVECQLGKHPGHAAAEPPPRSPRVRFGPEGGLGAHDRQFRRTAGRVLAARLRENVTPCFTTLCTGTLPGLASRPRRGADAEPRSRGCFTGKAD